MLHRFTEPIGHITLPTKFTYPFHYTPHSLCVVAANEIIKTIENAPLWRDAADQGKMFGVLVVRTDTDEVGYLTAFSGNMAQSNHHEGFVPPIYDLLNPDGFFKIEEEKISTINAQIEAIKSDSAYLHAQKQFEATQAVAQKAIFEAKELLKTNKAARETLRETTLTTDQTTQLIRESQHDKAELKRTERFWKEEIATQTVQLNTFKHTIDSLKAERKQRSAALQQKLFDQFQLLNALGETKGLCDIFKHTIHKTPPAGAGECAAPKLLQYAYAHQLKPLAMAEFWWGASPKTTIREQGNFYPSCKGKCEPILQHMLQGLDVEENPLLANQFEATSIEIIFEDEALLVVNKPAGMLTVPGKLPITSLYDWLILRYPEATGPMIVHRLDMATSGLLLVAKTKEVHKALQHQFKTRTVTKRYVALLSGIVSTKRGRIDLPLCLNPLDRPSQMVSYEFGKEAHTDYELLGYTEKGQTRIAFYPRTGRTHQLRVHAAHAEGLNTPIVGDELYGQKDERLFLHAEQITFTHPITGAVISLEKKAF
jgi:tRNA pseudouridine32 synthase/23S rRNA pseudouridine746 synthase